jgi:hypothetical protein
MLHVDLRVDSKNDLENDRAGRSRGVEGGLRRSIGPTLIREPFHTTKM